MDPRRFRLHTQNRNNLNHSCQACWQSSECKQKWKKFAPSTLKVSNRKCWTCFTFLIFSPTFLHLCLLTAQVDWVGLRVGGHSALSLRSSNEPRELSQWLWSWWHHHKHCHGCYYYYYSALALRRAGKNLFLRLVFRSSPECHCKLPLWFDIVKHRNAQYTVR